MRDLGRGEPATGDQKFYLSLSDQSTGVAS